MKELFGSLPRKWLNILFVFAVLEVGLFAYAYMRIFDLSQDMARVEERFRVFEDSVASSTLAIDQRLAVLDDKTSGLTTSLSNTQASVADVYTQVGGVKSQVGEISGTVGTLEKLQKTDPELLQKYSKVYFLNEHYVPERLIEINATDKFSADKVVQIHINVWPKLTEMLAATRAAGRELVVKSAYRSFAEQMQLKGVYTVTYGAGTANAFSADQGYSEHQLGTTVDLVTKGSTGALTESFDKTDTFKWLLNNAYRYGFTLSYTKNNDYYEYEPWHWRFVGVKLATDLHTNNLHFYDLDQREIDKYLINLFE